jgi:hypothetical protein
MAKQPNTSFERTDLIGDTRAAQAKRNVAIAKNAAGTAASSQFMHGFVEIFPLTRKLRIALFSLD